MNRHVKLEARGTIDYILLKKYTYPYNHNNSCYRSFVMQKKKSEYDFFWQSYFFFCWLFCDLIPRIFYRMAEKKMVQVFFHIFLLSKKLSEIYFRKLTSVKNRLFVCNVIYRKNWVNFLFKEFRLTLKIMQTNAFAIWFTNHESTKTLFREQKKQ